MIDGFTLWYVGAAPDAGALEAGRPVYGTPFLHRDPPGGALYVERPHIVRIFAHGTKLVVFFSTPLDPKSVSRENLSLRLDDTANPVAIRNAHFPVANHTEALVVELAAPLPDTAARANFSFKTPPAGLNGEPLTAWAADLRMVRIPDDATPVGLMRSLLAPTTD